MEPPLSVLLELLLVWSSFIATQAEWTIDMRTAMLIPIPPFVDSLQSFFLHNHKQCLIVPNSLGSIISWKYRSRFAFSYDLADRSSNS